MSPGRRNLLIVLLVFWLLVAWLIVSLRLETGWLDMLRQMLPIFVSGGLLIALIVSIERLPTEQNIVVIRRDFFGMLDVFENKKYFMFPMLFNVVAKMPAYALTSEALVEMIDTRTARLLRINAVRVRCTYKITDYKACLANAATAYARIKELDERQQIKPTNPALWIIVLEHVVSGLVDDNLRTMVWTWQQPIDKDSASKANNEDSASKANNEDSASKANLLSVNSSPPKTPPILENDPYDLSLNREKLSQKVFAQLERSLQGWGVSVSALVLEAIVVDPELITKRNRNKQGELNEATHQAQLDYIAIRARGIAEADVRARTVRRILEELVAAKNLPQLTEKTVAEIVRAAMYSDGEMIWKGVLEKSLPGAPGTTGTPPGTAKTA